MKKESRIPQGWKCLCAEVISWLFFPPFVGTVFFIFLVFWYSNDFSEGLRWLVFVSPFLFFIPLIFFALSFKFGWISDVDLSDRRERPVFLIVFTASLAAASAILYFLHVPSQFVAYALSGLVMTIIASAITLFWKISFHTAVTSSIVTAIFVLGGSHFWLLFLFLPPVGWSRITLKKHTFFQVAGGAIVAFLVTSGVFHLFGYKWWI